MSCNNCNDNTPCQDPCTDPNPCYQDCGCLNPTTFPCITQPGAGLVNIPISSDMNGAQVLQAIDQKIGQMQDQLDAAEDAGGVYTDTKVKVSNADTTEGYLYDKVTSDATIKRTISNASANELLRLRVDPEALVSADASNAIGLGTDGKLRVILPAGSQLNLAEGNGITLAGTGTSDDPIIISTNDSISVARTCFDGVWKNVTLVTPGSASVTYSAGQPKYRVRYDGSIEFKGSATYIVQFGAYSSGNRKYTLQVGSIPTTCVTSGEQAGTSDLKAITYIDGPQPGEEQIVQQYGYIVRKINSDIYIEFQSSFTNATTKTIVVNFEGVISHPNF